MTTRFRLWTIVQVDRDDDELANVAGYGRTRDEVLDDFQIRHADEAQMDFGEHALSGEHDPESLELALQHGNEVHGFFYANPEATTFIDDHGFLWIVGWEYAPNWMTGLLEEWNGTEWTTLPA